MKIYGAGLAGLLAGCLNQTAKIFEQGPATQAQHKAVLRFRSPAVGDAVGIEFRKVRVHKGIWVDGFVDPTIQFANWYSKKVIGRLGDRSIWNVDPSDRWIAPENFIEQLAERCTNRIFWEHAVTSKDLLYSGMPDRGDPIISTLPMPVMMSLIGYVGNSPEFKYSPIVVKRWRVPKADVFQTIYFPTPSRTLYRATITGDLLIAEFIENAEGNFDLFDAFGIEDAEPLETTSQRFGKIAPIDDAWRKQFMFDLTQRYNIYSVGRFATWRNLLLDDVLVDLGVVRRMMNVSGYDRARHPSNL